MRSHNLTEKQLNLLRWFVQEVRAGRLDAEEIWISWTFDGNSIANYVGEVPEIKSTALDALASAGYLVCSRRSDTAYQCALTGRGYEMVEMILKAEQPSQITLPTSISSVTASRQRQLEKQLQGCQKEWDLRNEKVNSFREALAIEASANVKFQLEKQIETEKRKLTELDQEIESLEKALQASQAGLTEPPKKLEG